MSLNRKIQGGALLPVYVDNDVHIASDTPVVISGGVSIAAATRTTFTATIAAGASLSGAIDLGDNTLILISMPAAWTTATLSIQSSIDGVTYQETKISDALLSYNPLVACNQSIEPTDLLGCRWIKIRSGTAAVPVNQAAERLIRLVARLI